MTNFVDYYFRKYKIIVMTMIFMKEMTDGSIFFWIFGIVARMKCKQLSP